VASTHLALVMLHALTVPLEGMLLVVVTHPAVRVQQAVKEMPQV